MPWIIFVLFTIFICLIIDNKENIEKQTIKNSTYELKLFDNYNNIVNIWTIDNGSYDQLINNNDINSNHIYFNDIKTNKKYLIFFKNTDRIIIEENIQQIKK